MRRGTGRGRRRREGAGLPSRRPAPSVRELQERLGAAAVGREAGLQRLRRGRLAVRVRGRGVGALAGAAACLRAGAGLLHLPSLRQRRLVHILQAEALPLVFVEGLGERKEAGGAPVKVKAWTCSWQLRLRKTTPELFGEPRPKTTTGKPPGRAQPSMQEISEGSVHIAPARLSRSHDSNASLDVRARPRHKNMDWLETPKDYHQSKPSHDHVPRD